MIGFKIAAMASVATQTNELCACFADIVTNEGISAPFTHNKFWIAKRKLIQLIFFYRV